MSFKVVKEDEEMFARTGVLEDCFFCRKKTRFWHEETNNPVCRVCAEINESSALPNWRKRASQPK